MEVAAGFAVVEYKDVSVPHCEGSLGVYQSIDSSFADTEVEAASIN